MPEVRFIQVGFGNNFPEFMSRAIPVFLIPLSPESYIQRKERIIMLIILLKTPATQVQPKSQKGSKVIYKIQGNRKSSFISLRAYT